MFTYDISRKDKYIISATDNNDDDDTLHICIDCIKRIKEFELKG